MIETTIIGIVLTVMLLILPRLSIRPFGIPRNTALAFSLPVAFVLWVMAGGPVAVDGLILGLGAAIVVLMLTSAAFAKRADLCLTYSIKYIAAIFLGLVAVPMVDADRVQIAMVAAAALCSLVSMIQRKIRSAALLDNKAHTFGGFTGNTNWLGAYLAPHFFLSLPYVQIDPVYTLMSFVILAGLVWSGCRAAIFAAYVGSLFVVPPVFIILTMVGILVGFALLPKFRSLKSFKIRLDMWDFSRRFIDWKVALIGLGPAGSKNELGRVSGRVDGRRSRFLLVHNDFLQWILDGGSGFAALQIAVVGFSIMRAMYAGETYLAAALVCIAVNGLALHLHHLTVVVLTFWIVVGRANCSPDLFLYPIPPELAVVVALLLFVVVATIWGRVFLCDVLLRYSQRQPADKQFRTVLKAHQICPTNTMAGGVCCSHLINQGQKLAAFHKASEIIHRNDSLNDPAEVYFVHGLTAFNLGALAIARTSFKTALYHHPGHKNASRLLGKVEERCSDLSKK